MEMVAAMVLPSLFYDQGHEHWKGEHSRGYYFIQRCRTCRFCIPALFTALDVNPKEVIVIKFTVIKREADLRNSEERQSSLLFRILRKFQIIYLEVRSKVELENCG